jgi:RimJ/RimL family protein N-acetyltransferase
MVSLELLEESHVPRIALLANDPRISATSGVPPCCGVDVVRGWASSNAVEMPKEITFVVLSDRTPVGCCILKKVDWLQRNAELSYWLGFEHWGMGVASSAAEILRDFAFEVYHFEFLHSHYLRESNVASGRILEKLGFVPDEVRQDLPVEGRFQYLSPDVWTFRILRRFAWQASRKSRTWALTKTEHV